MSIHLIDQAIEEFLAGWAAGDGKRFAAPFASDCRYVVFDGTVLTGSQEIATFHQSAFDTHLKKTVLHLNVQDIREVSKGCWLVFSTADIGRSDGSPTERTGHSIQTFCFKQTGEVANISAFQNTRVHPITDHKSAEAWRKFDLFWKA